MKFRKKPIVIDAEQFIPEKNVLGKMSSNILTVYRDEVHSETGWMISTLEGTMEVTPNDWIIVGVNGEVYPCKPDIFEKTYDKVEEGGKNNNG